MEESVRPLREVRPGRPLRRGACKECNPAGLPAPSPTQYHATVFLTVLAVMAILAMFLLLRA
jgi:hypothetical protein